MSMSYISPGFALFSMGYKHGCVFMFLYGRKLFARNVPSSLWTVAND